MDKPDHITNQKLDGFCLNESETRQFHFELVHPLCLIVLHLKVNIHIINLIARFIINNSRYIYQNIVQGINTKLRYLDCYLTLHCKFYCVFPWGRFENPSKLRMRKKRPRFNTYITWYLY